METPNRVATPISPGERRDAWPRVSEGLGIRGLWLRPGTPVRVVNENANQVRTNDDRDGLGGVRRLTDHGNDRERQQKDEQKCYDKSRYGCYLPPKPGPQS